MLLAAVLFQASTAIFAPPLDVPLRVVSERSQSGARQYVMERTVRFTREAGGYRAEVRMTRADGTTPDATGALYEAGYGAFAGQTIVFHLDAAGAVLAVDGLAQLWEAFCARVAQAAAGQRTLAPAARQALEQRVAAPLRALPIARQHGLIASLVTTIVAGEAPAPGVEPVHLPGSSPFGGPITLDGNRITTAAGGLLETATLAGADTALPAEAGAPSRTARVEVEIRRRIDPRTGLIVAMSETNRTTAGAGAGKQVVERVLTTRVIGAD